MRLGQRPLAAVILLTALLGFLINFPTSAAPAASIPGTIQFLELNGDDKVTRVSLNGPAATVGIQLRIADKDLDVTIKREGDNADVLDSSRLSSGDVLPRDGETWFDLQDMNDDGRVNIRDIRALDQSGASTVTDTETIWYDRNNGILRVPANTAKLEYWIKTITTLGSQTGSSASEPGRDQQGQAIYDSLAHDNDIPVPEGHSLLQEGYGWIDVLEAGFEGLKERQDTEVVQAILGASIRAFNETPATSGEGDLLVDAFFTPSGNGGQTPAAVSFRVFNGESVGEPGDPGFQAASEVGVGPGGQPSNVVVEYRYWGNSDSAYPDRLAPPANQSTPQTGGNVVIRTYAAPEGINATLQETHASSGIYVATIVICEAGSDSCAAEQTESISLPVYREGDSIEVIYEDDSPSSTRVAELPVRMDPPFLSHFFPPTNSAGKEAEPTISFLATNTEFGVSESEDDIDSIYVVAGLYDLLAEQASDSVVLERDELDLAPIADGFSASVTIMEGRDDHDELNPHQLTEDSQYEIRWWAISSDSAGNVGVSDADDETRCTIQSDDFDDFKFSTKRTQEQAGELIRVLEDTFDFQAGCDPHVIRVDNASPSLERAVTGSWLNEDNVEMEGPDAIRTSIAAIFDEDVDCSTIKPDGIEVNGVNPNALTCKDARVYLSVDDLVSNSTPTVRVLEAAISDRAGNPVVAGSAIAEDSIPAKLTVNLTGTGSHQPRPVTTRNITVTLSSDEPLSSAPIITINRVGDDYSLIRSSQGEAIPSGEANRWVYAAAFTRDGLYNLRTSGVDRGGRIETAIGLDETEFDSSSLIDLDAIFFEVDSVLHPPTLSPRDHDTTENPNTFVSIHFENEHAEYGLTRETDNDLPPPLKIRKSTTDPSLVDVNFDTHKGVTLTKAIFNGEDVLPEIVTRDNVRFIYHNGDLPLGEHRLALEARDAAGNRWSDTLNFTLVEPQPYKLPIEPGLNLVSLPAEPENGSIASIFGELPDITSIFTYDNPDKRWKTATRLDDGSFSGDLETMDADHGYFIVSKSATNLEVMLLRVNDFLYLPHVDVFEGWNLVPVTDSGRSPSGTTIKAPQYFANIDATAAFGYDSANAILTRLSLSQDSNDKVAVGSAYWVYANEDGVIVP